MKPKYFDIHSHLNSPDYSNDKEEVLARLEETETHTIVVGTDYKSSKEAVDLADKYKEVYACIGVHPVDNPERTFERDLFQDLVKHPKVVAIGECGFDFFHSAREADYQRQEKLFLSQIEFAIEHDKPLMIHTRDSYEEVINTLEKAKEAHPQLRGNIHFFSGDLATAKRFIDLDFTLSFTGVVTFVRDYDDVIRNLPLDKIMAETDAPWVAPVPYRGKRNEPSYVAEVVKKIAEIRGEDLEYVREALVNNALRMIG